MVTTALVDEEFSFLDVCPVEGWVDLVADSLAAVDGPILADSLSGQRFVATARNEAIGVDWISCEFNGDGDGSAGLLFGPSPVDFESYANDYADVAVNDVQLTLALLPGSIRICWSNSSSEVREQRHSTSNPCEPRSRNASSRSLMR